LLAILADPAEVAAALPLLAPSMVVVSVHILKAAAHTDLTRRQCAILELVSSGATNSEIANELYVSPATVKREVARLCRLFNANSRLQLALAAQRQGVLKQ
jgi:DNA-binding NarL/FixJ family response regulator